MMDLIIQFNNKKLNKFNKFFSMFSDRSLLNIEDILPDYYYEEYKSLEEESFKEISDIDSEFGYIDIFNKKQRIFESLCKAKINGIVYIAFKEVEKNETLLSNLNSFKPTNGFCKVAKYNQSKTITGRLTTLKNSPNILTLPSRHRKIFKSRWDKGSLFQIDFKTLEPRVIRKINKRSESDDIYLELSNKFDFVIDRIVIKRAIISVLYGKTTPIEGISKEKSDLILNKVNEYFDINNIFNISKIRYADGCRRNFYGKPIWNIKEDNKNKIVNNYIQSTAVDVALLYFSELCDKLDMNLCKPLFIIHDALICDVNEDYKDTFFKIVNEGFNCPRLGHFPVEITDLLEYVNE